MERLEKDFKDGILLISLLEILTGKECDRAFALRLNNGILGKELAKSTLWSRKLMNNEIGKLDTLTVAFKFMQSTCRIHLTNCGPAGTFKRSY